MVGEIISAIGTLLGAVGVFLTMKSNKKNKELKTITWSDMQSATKYFWRKLKSEKFQPEYIITPRQKGGIIAQLINDFYEEEIPVLTGFLEKKGKERANDSDYLTLNTTKWHVCLPKILKTCEEKENIKILIVDDFVMSGDFMYTIRQTLLELGYSEKNICSCVIAVTKVAMDANKAPNYHWKVVNDKDFYFPWGKAE